MTDINIATLGIRDRSALQALLVAAELPTEDLTSTSLGDFLAARAGDTLIGAAGLERHGDTALLRSVVVDKTLRGTGLGQRLVAAMEARARELGVRRLYLLTTTADKFFGRLGYRALARDEAPVAIQATAQFSQLCPSSSAFMMKALEARVYNVLFLCTGNSARSILAESVMNNLAIGGGRFKAYSAGSHPKDAVNPFTLETLQANKFPVTDLRSKSWDEFAAPGAPALDFVFTVCDQAAQEACPYWPGQPMTAHWGLPDPAAEQGTDEAKRKAFRDTLMVLRRRIELFASLPFDKLDKLSIQKHIKDIGTR